MRLDMLSKAMRTAHEAAPKLKQLEKASKGVEAMFVKSLLGEMQKGSKLFGDGPGTDIYADLFNDAIAKQVADRGAFGIADLMIKQGAPKILAETAKANNEGTKTELGTQHPKT